MFLVLIETCDPNSKVPLIIFQYNSLSIGDLKGNDPFARANMTTPTAQTSARSPQYSFLSTSSGDM